MKIRVDVDTARIMRERGLGGDNRARVYLASMVGRLSDKYVPMNGGSLSKERIVASDGSTLTYTMPYAHYQWYGKVMGPNVKIEEGAKDGWRSMAPKGGKKYTGKDLDYAGSPLRGPDWVGRMMRDRSKDVADDLKNYIGRLAK